MTNFMYIQIIKKITSEKFSDYNVLYKEFENALQSKNHMKGQSQESNSTACIEHHGVGQEHDKIDSPTDIMAFYFRCCRRTRFQTMRMNILIQIEN